MSNDIINNVLVRLEQNLTNVVKYYKLYMRDEIKQETRIRLWKMMAFAVEDNSSTTEEELFELCSNHIYSMSIYCSKLVRIKEYYNYHKHIVPIDDFEFPITENVKAIFCEIDLEKYKTVLNKKEFKILQYLYETDYSFVNFDEISRQLGYTGKGSFKYLLTKIAEKINEFNEISEKKLLKQ